MVELWNGWLAGRCLPLTPRRPVPKGYVENRTAVGVPTMAGSASLADSLMVVIEAIVSAIRASAFDSCTAALLDNLGGAYATCRRQSSTSAIRAGTCSAGSAAEVYTVCRRGGVSKMGEQGRKNKGCIQVQPAYGAPSPWDRWEEPRHLPKASGQTLTPASTASSAGPS